MAKRTFIEDFRKFFGRGLAILLPSILTLWILWQLVAFVYTNVGAPINRAIRLGVLEVMPLVLGDVEEPKPANGQGPDEPGDEDVADPSVPEWYAPTDRQIRAYLEQRAEGGFESIPPVGTEAYEQRFERGRVELRRALFRKWWNEHWYLEATGLIVAIVLIYLSGVLLGNLIGRRIYASLEKVFARVPVLKHIYPHVKQLVDLVMGEKKMAFSRAVLIQWPSKGFWTVGLVTGESIPAIKTASGGEVLAIFIPSTPTPFTGFTVTIRAEEAVDLPISIDHAMRFIITAGVLSGDGSDGPHPVPPVAALDANAPRTDGSPAPAGLKTLNPDTQGQVAPESPDGDSSRES